MKQKKRLDQLVQERNPSLSKTYIQSLIMQGNVLVDGKVCTKSGTQVADEVVITLVQNEQKFVSRAGYKLEKALDFFKVNAQDSIVLDAGLSTGGFADCLLQHGAKKIYGIDVGYGQAHEKIRRDPRVVVMEKTNLRHLDELPELVDLVTLDLSFISVLKVIPTIKKLMKPEAHLIVLIKPQFEARREQVGKGGIIKDPKVHEEVIHNIVRGITQEGFSYLGVTDSPITGTDGNKEFLAYFKKNIV